MANIITINEITDSALDLYIRTTENQLLHYNEPQKEGLFIAESPNVILRALSAGYEPVSFLVESKYISSYGDAKHQGLLLEVLQDHPDTPVYTASSDLLNQITGFHLTRGLLSILKRKETPEPEEICSPARRIAILENVMNPTNVGAIFRSAAALNMDAILLTEGCADPLYRRAARVSMGTVFQIPWTYISNWNENGLSRLRDLGFATAAMALDDNSISISDKALTKENKLALVLGTEGDGLAKNTIQGCDYTVKIPMAHGVDSLNVAAASAVAFWELTR